MQRNGPCGGVATREETLPRLAHKDALDALLADYIATRCLFVRWNAAVSPPDKVIETISGVSSGCHSLIAHVSSVTWDAMFFY